MRNKHEQFEQETPKLKVQLHRFVLELSIFQHDTVVE